MSSIDIRGKERKEKMLMSLWTSVKAQNFMRGRSEGLLLQIPTCRVPCAEVRPAHTSKGCKTGPGTVVAQVCSHRTHLGNEVIPDGQAVPFAPSGFWK